MVEGPPPEVDTESVTEDERRRTTAPPVAAPVTPPVTPAGSAPGGTTPAAPPDERPDERPDPFGLISGGEGLITGTIVCASVIAAAGNFAHSTIQLALAILGTVLVYWLAHLHANAVARAVAEGHRPLRALRLAARHTWPIAAASLLPSVFLLGSELTGATLRTAAWTALFATVGLLAAYSYLAGRRSGLGVWGSLAAAVAGAGLGCLVALVKSMLH